ncbi:hypothetical protein [Fictibacillus fluitans]|uniref:Uncharacterized protein n=1 Tax=Fictibacillus fluitans TaxID=3058422 RepID=A0ABT8I0S0_9BACL|nr:hypothetical protein [Fictibacillus sp. NE201]MDN4526617.1 hypothetical protein [Fictibacillus sp. NE201]
MSVTERSVNHPFFYNGSGKFTADANKTSSTQLVTGAARKCIGANPYFTRTENKETSTQQ